MMKRKGMHETGGFQAVPEQPPAGKKSRKGLIAGGIIGGILLLAAALFGVAMACVGNVETVYPNVRLGGYALGGLYYEEAAELLSLADWTYPERPEVSVELPGGGFDETYRQARMH